MTGTEPFFTAELRQRPLDITGIENALLDLLVRVKDYQIDDFGLVKGTMKLVDTEEQGRILDHVGGLKPEITPGGSCANVLRTAALLGARTSYSSAVGLDVFGEAFEHGLDHHGVRDRLIKLKGATGTSVILISPDGERTMNTHLGVCRAYSPRHVPIDDIKGSRLFFTTAYMWDTQNQIEAIELAIATARENGAKLAIDLADPFAVGRSKDVLLKHFERGFDVVFANAEEARIMVGTDGEAAARELAKSIDVVAVKAGADGAFVCHGDELVHVAAHAVEVVDTTGAGDCFAAGFLYGLVRELPLETCGKIATLLASDTITHMGVKVSHDIVERVHELC